MDLVLIIVVVAVVVVAVVDVDVVEKHTAHSGPDSISYKTGSITPTYPSVKYALFRVYIYIYILRERERP